ncbi:MAG TPA: hypothetical protein VKB17_00770 [Thermoleophilaceae bacterium]|nr:hypothetical protein [Thermoleophilaceae bacterium]
MNGLELRRPRDINALFGDALRAYRSHAGTFLIVSAAVVVPAELAVSGVGLEQLTGPYDDSPSLAETILPTLVGFLVVAPLITATCIYALSEIAASGAPRAGGTLAAGLDAFAPIFFAVVLAALGIALGLLLLIVPGVFLAVRWYFVPQAVVLENASGPAALAASGRVVEGFWWRTFGIVILANVAATLPGLLLIGPFAGIAHSTDRAVWSLVGQMAAETVTTPFVALLSTLLYFDLRARRAVAGS